MKQLFITRGAAVVLFLTLALVTAGFSFAAVAQSASRMQVLSAGADGTDACVPLEPDSATVKQGESFAVDVQGLTAEEPVYLTMVFPDGRVFSPSVAGVEGPQGLDGALDQPADPGFIVQANSGGDYVGFIQTTAKWPLGCYQVIAQGVTSQIQISDYVEVVAAAPPVPVGGPLGLLAQSRTGQQPSGEQGVVVDIFGRRFMSGETILLQMVQPDGTVVDLPQEVQPDGTVIRPSPPVVSTVGSFQIAITFGTTYQEGDYLIIARSGNGQSISAPFKLRRQAVTARGFGLLNISNPAGAAAASQGQSIQLQGRRFRAGEHVSLTLIQANGTRRPLAAVQTNQLGEFTTDLPLSRQLPTGQHTLLAMSASTVVTRALQLNLGKPVVPSGAAFAPITAPGAGAQPTPAPSATAAPSPAAVPSPTPDPSATTVPSPTPDPSPSATAMPAAPTPPLTTTTTSDFQGDPCSCDPNFAVDYGVGAPAGVPSELIPITDGPPAAVPTPSF